MVLLLMAPVLVGAAAAHRMLQLYAPSNLLIAQARVRPPEWRTVLVLAGVALAALVLMHGLDVAVSAGAPAWINLVVLILAWDAIKFGVASALVAARCLLRPLRGHAQRVFGVGKGRNSLDPPEPH